MRPRAWVAFAAMSAIWGIPYLFIKIAIDGGMTPVRLPSGRRRKPDSTIAKPVKMGL